LFDFSYLELIFYLNLVHVMKKIALIILLAISALGCPNNNKIPNCIQDKITTFENDNWANGKITRYIFQGDDVYFLNDGSFIADGLFEVVDKDCNTICSLGGIAGIRECNGEIFDDVAVEEEVIWEE